MKYKKFRFEKHHFDYDSGVLKLHYSYDHERFYTEKIRFQLPDDLESIDHKVIDALSFYTFIIAGSSYYKSFIAPEIEIVDDTIDYWQADFFNMIYRGGLSQFIYENNLKPSDLAEFSGTENGGTAATDYDGAGVLMMQSGGKDSLLAAELMKESENEFVSWHLSTTGRHPQVIDAIGAPVVVSKRTIDLDSINEDKSNGGLNGHIPFSALFAGFALIQGALLSKNIVMASNEASADQANVEVDDMSVNHQFTKTYDVEISIEQYLKRYVSADLHYGSILRPLNELQVAKLFAAKGWPKYRHLYSSCNLANYKQKADDGNLTWDGTCPKCANTFVLMAPYVPKEELLALFNDKNLLKDEELTETYKQLFGLSDKKPFECVGTFEELSHAYVLAGKKDEDFQNPNIVVVPADFDESKLGPYQKYFDEFIDYKSLI